MGTINYGYEHRCIEVTNEDVEYEIHPAIDRGRWMRCQGRDSRPLRDYEFEFWQGVLTYGYYDGACIDYLKKESDENETLTLDEIWNAWPKTKAQLLAELNSGYERKVRLKVGEKEAKYQPLRIGRTRFYELVKGLDMKDEKQYDQIFAILWEYLSKREEKLVNQALDSIVEEYEYDEYEYYGWTCKLKPRKIA